VIMITHDLGVVADVADKALVMYSGRVVECGTLDDIFYDPPAPVHVGLLGSITRVDGDRPNGCRHSRAATVAPQRIAGVPLPRPLPAPFGACGERPELEQRGGAEGHLDRCFLSASRSAIGALARTDASGWPSRERPPDG